MKKIPFKTVLAILLILIVMLTYHTYIHLNIDRERYDNSWGYETEVSFSEMNAEPIAGKIGENLLIITFEDSGNLYYKLINKEGEVISEDREDISKLNNNKAQNLELVNRELFFITNNNMYKLTFSQENGFSEKILVKENISGFNVVDDDNFTLYNSNEIYSYSYIDENLEENQAFTLNEDNIIDAFVLNKNGNSILITYRKKSSEEVNVYYNLINFDNNPVEIGTIKSVYNIYKGGTENTLNDGVLTVNSNFTEYGQQGSKTLKKLLYSINLKNQDLLYSKVINSNNFKDIINLEDIVDLETINGEVYMIGSGFNPENNYTNNNDIFITKINSSGEFYDTSYISNTFKYSQNPTLVESNGEAHSFWFEVESDNYKVMYNSNNEEFLGKSSKIKTDEIKDAMLKASSGPFFALSMLFIKSSIMIVLFFAVLAVAYMIMYNKDLYEENNERIRKAILIGIFIIINLISFKFNYIEGTRLYQTPSYLIGGISNIVVPLLINIFSIGIFYILDRERKEMGLLWKLLFLLVLDAFIANLIYTPFIMINKIII
ncbi:MAG: hypothetical protein SCJ93_03550 [Bacillota bacterium]|nr:hypothetical protein [Bacillota bacterium]